MPLPAEAGVPGIPAASRTVAAFARLLKPYRRLTVLTGAGCSVASGIPDYRDRDGAWKHPQPIQYASFVNDPLARQRYWARAAAGWRRMARAEPNPAHMALARLERAGLVTHLITQNVDGLHQAAGSGAVTDLHGRLDRVRCLGCGTRCSRASLQYELEARNPQWPLDAAPGPDGDARPDRDFRGFQVPACAACGGVLKPDVVFFGEAVPPERVHRAMDAVAGAEALLVVGSSLMVFSGFRFAREAARLGRPVFAVNLGRTRADDLLAGKLALDCSLALPALVAHLAPEA